MATFTITASNTNIDTLSGKTGGDVYNVNGGQLVIDQDSRYGANQSTSATLGNMTISATLGGEILIDGASVRLIPYNTGTGTVPAAGTTISQGGVSAKLIGVWSAVNSAPTAAAAAMPASGFIKVKQKTGGDFAAGALTGISASATGADVVGWIDLSGDESATCTVPRLGTFNVNGGWYSLGTTNGTANQQLQAPTSGLTAYIPGVFIEKSVGSGDYEFYPNAASQTTVATDIRAKVVWISTAGLVRIGHNGTANAGYVPVTGLSVVIPNVIFHCNTTAARTAHALPNATLATRYDFTTTGAGVIDVDRGMFNWYLSLAQPFSVSLANSCAAESVSITECASEVVLDTFGVGQTAAQTNVALVLGLCFAGVTMTDCHFSRATLASSGHYTVTITDCNDVTVTNCRYTALTVKGNATTGNILATCVNRWNATGMDLTNGRVVLVTCTYARFTDTSYADVITGTTTTTAAQQSYIFDLQLSTSDVIISGVDFHGLTNVHPYLGILLFTAAGVNKVRLRNIGSRASPLSLGSANQSAYLLVGTTGAAARDIKVQRCYVSNTRTGLHTFDNSFSDIVYENVAGDYADAPVIASLNTTHKGVGATWSTTAQTSVYGTHWQDFFTSATAGRIGIAMNETTASTTSQVTLGNGAKFTSAGGLYMPTIGMTAEFVMPYYALGHASFQNLTATMGGGTIGNYTLQYQIDKNDGAGWNGTWKTLSGANLSAETGISASLGIKLKILITTGTTNSTAITSLYVATTMVAADQDNLYPLDVVPVEITVKDVNTLAPIEGARVFMEADSGGPLPSSESVTITRSGSVASVSHTAHGMSNGDSVVIRGAAQTEYNGVKIIYNVTTNAYDFTVSGTPTTPATGTITATAVLMNALTNASGVVSNAALPYSSDQPVRGKIRLASGGTYYKTTSIVDTVSDEGLASTYLMVPDN